MLFAQRQLELAVRRESLRARSEQLRGELAEQATVVRLPLQLADRAWRGWRWVKAHPEAVVVAVIRPRRVWVLARWSWRTWRTWRRVRFLAVDLLSGYRRAWRRLRPAQI